MPVSMILWMSCIARPRMRCEIASASVSYASPPVAPGLRLEGIVMLRVGLRLLLVSVVLMGIGWLFRIDSAIVEVIRIASIVCLGLGMVLLLINYVRTPDPEDG